MESIAAHRNGKQLQCPKCRLPLNVALQDEIEIDVCSKCHGLWADFVEEKKLLQMQPEVFTMDELRRLRREYQPVFQSEPIQYIPCPVCEKLMHRKNWGSHSGIIIDRCEKHGSWYDAGEVEKIRTFIKMGGIEYEKMKSPEKESQRLESNFEAKALRLDKKIDSRYRWARIFSMLGL